MGNFSVIKLWQGLIGKSDELSFFLPHYIMTAGNLLWWENVWDYLPMFYTAKVSYSTLAITVHVVYLFQMVQYLLFYCTLVLHSSLFSMFVTGSCLMYGMNQ